jgi:hypothetical protein
MFFKNRAKSFPLKLSWCNDPSNIPYKPCISQRFFLQLTLEASAVDQDTAFGGNLYDIHTPLSDTDKSFLEEESTIQYVELKSSLLVSPTDFFWTRIGYSFYFGDYKGSRLEGTIGLTW